MTTIRRANKLGRNEPCVCGSNVKFKKCCGGNGSAQRHYATQPQVTYIDSGEAAVRWVICDQKGTSFFSTKDNQILVFTDKATAFAIAGLADFSGQEYGEINVAGVGETKFKHLCETLPHIEVADIDTAVALIQERIASKTQTEGEVSHGSDAQEEGSQEGQQDGQQEVQQEAEQGSSAQEAADGGAEAGA
jgi:hypothetical protein